MNNGNINVQMECLEEIELQNYLDGNLSLAQTERVEQHLAVCNRCYLMLKVLEPSDFDEEYEPQGYEPAQKLPEWMDGYALELADRQKKINANKRSLEQVLSNGGVKFAQMWKPKTDNILIVTPEGNEYHSFIDFNSVPHFVVVTNEDAEKLLDHKLVRAFPIHDAEDLTNEYDLLLNEGNSPTGYSFFIQSWNPSEILIDNLDVCIGEVSFQGQTELAKKLRKLGQKQLIKKVDAYVAGTEDDIPEIGIDKKYFKKNYKTDPLIRYRYKEFKETSYLRVPAESLRETALFEATSQSSYWERFKTMISAFNMQPVGAFAVLIVVAGMIYWFFPLMSQISVSEVAENNSNIAQPIIPDKQIDPQNSNTSQSNLAENQNSVQNNQNTNDENYINEKQKNSSSPQNKINKKDSTINPNEQQKKEKQPDRQKQSSNPLNLLNPRPEVAGRINKDGKDNVNGSNDQQFKYKLDEVAQKNRSEQKPLKLEEDIRLPKEKNNVSRNGGGVIIGAILGGKKGALIGSGLGSELYNKKFLLSPNGTYVRTTNPTLRWGRIGKYDNYRVWIFDYRDVEITSADVNGNSWTSNKELTPGVLYSWKVAPLDKNKVELAVANLKLEGSFKVLNAKQQQRVENVEKIAKTPSLKLARVYLRNALFEDAITELEKYLIVNPKSAEAKQLLDLANHPQKITNSKKN